MNLPSLNVSSARRNNGQWSHRSPRQYSQNVKNSYQGGYSPRSPRAVGNVYNSNANYNTNKYGINSSSKSSRGNKFAFADAHHKNTRNSRGYQPRRNHYKASRPSNNENLNNPYRNQNFNRNRIQFGNHYNSNQNRSSFHKNSELTKVPKLNLDSWAHQRTAENQHGSPYKKQKSATARGKL